MALALPPSLPSFHEREEGRQDKTKKRVEEVPPSLHTLSCPFICSALRSLIKKNPPLPPQINIKSKRKRGQGPAIIHSFEAPIPGLNGIDNISPVPREKRATPKNKGRDE